MLRRRIWELVVIFALLLTVYLFICNPSLVTNAQRMLSPSYPYPGMYGIYMPEIMKTFYIPPPHTIDLIP